MDRVIDGIKRQSKIEAEGNLDAEAKRIAGLNKRMTKDLRFQTQVPQTLCCFSSSICTIHILIYKRLPADAWYTIRITST